MDNALFATLLSGISSDNPDTAMADLAQLYEFIRRSELTPAQRTACYEAHRTIPHELYLSSPSYPYLVMLTGLILSTEGTNPSKNLSLAAQFLGVAHPLVQVALYGKLMYLPVTTLTGDPPSLSVVPGNIAILTAYGQHCGMNLQLALYLQAYAADPKSTQPLISAEKLLKFLPSAIDNYTHYSLSTLSLPAEMVSLIENDPGWQEHIYQRLIKNPFITGVQPSIEEIFVSLSDKKKAKLQEHFSKNMTMKQAYERQKNEILSSNKWPNSLCPVQRGQKYPLLVAALIQGDTDLAEGLVKRLTPDELATINTTTTDNTLFDAIGSNVQRFAGLKYFDQVFTYHMTDRRAFQQWIDERTAAISNEEDANTKAAAEQEKQRLLDDVEGWVRSDPAVSSSLFDAISAQRVNETERSRLYQHCAGIADDNNRSSAEKSQALALQGLILINAQTPSFLAAASLLDKAIALDPSNPWALTLRGIMHANGLGGKVNKNEAVILLKAASSAADHPAAKTALYYLGSVYDDPKKPAYKADALALYWQAYSLGQNASTIERDVGKFFTVENLFDAIPKYRVPVLKFPRVWTMLPAQNSLTIVKTIFGNPVITAIVPDIDEVLNFLRPEFAASLKNELENHLANNDALKKAYEDAKVALLANNDVWPATMEKTIHGTNANKTYSMLELSIRYGDSDFTQSILRHMPHEQLLGLTQKREDTPVNGQQYPYEALAGIYPTGVRRANFRQWVDEAKQNPLINILGYLEGKSTARGGEKLRYNDRVADFNEILDQLRTLATQGGMNAVAKHAASAIGKDPDLADFEKGERSIIFNPAAPNFDDFKEIFVEMMRLQRVKHPIAGQTFFSIPTSQEQYLKFCEQLKTMPGEALYCCLKQFDAHLDQCQPSATVNALKGVRSSTLSAVEGPLVQPEDQPDQPKRPGFSPHEDL